MFVNSSSYFQNLLEIIISSTMQSKIELFLASFFLVFNVKLYKLCKKYIFSNFFIIYPVETVIQGFSLTFIVTTKTHWTSVTLTLVLNFNQDIESFLR